MVEEDIARTAFKCPEAIGLYEWIVIMFGLKNKGAKYQRAMNYIFRHLINKVLEIHINDVVAKSRRL